MRKTYYANYADFNQKAQKRAILRKNEQKLFSSQIIDNQGINCASNTYAGVAQW
jgi:hypothetical protein